MLKHYAQSFEPNAALKKAAEAYKDAVTSGRLKTND